MTIVEHNSYVLAKAINKWIKIKGYILARTNDPPVHDKLPIRVFESIIKRRYLIANYVNNQSIIKGGPFPDNFVVHNDIFFFTCPHGKFHISYHYLISLLDNINHQWNQYYLSTVQDDIDPIEVDRCEDFTNFMKSVNYLYNAGGEKMYDDRKDYEPLVVGAILKLDPLVESRQLWEETFKGILEVCPSFTGTYMYTRLQPNYLDFDKNYKHHLLGSLGWLKCFGHPHIKPELGLEQMLNNIEKGKIKVIEEAVNISYQFKKMFITGYYLKHHTWPKVRDPPPFTRLFIQSLCHKYLAIKLPVQKY